MSLTKPKLDITVQEDQVGHQQWRPQPTRLQTSTPRGNANPNPKPRGNPNPHTTPDFNGVTVQVAAKAGVELKVATLILTSRPHLKPLVPETHPNANANANATSRLELSSETIRSLVPM